MFKIRRELYQHEGHWSASNRWEVVGHDGDTLMGGFPSREEAEQAKIKLENTMAKLERLKARLRPN